MDKQEIIVERSGLGIETDINLTTDRIVCILDSIKSILSGYDRCIDNDVKKMLDALAESGKMYAQLLNAYIGKLNISDSGAASEWNKAGA